MPVNVRPIRIEGNIAYVPLTRGYEAIIDAADVHLVEGFNWTAMVRDRTVHAYRKTPRPECACIYLHRAIMDPPPGMLVDHKSCDGLDCRRENMRIASKGDNQRNQRRRLTNKSGFKGVFWANRESRWLAKINLNGKTHHIGTFETPEAAHAAYCEASVRLHGEFSRTE